MKKNHKIELAMHSERKRIEIRCVCFAFCFKNIGKIAVMEIADLYFFWNDPGKGGLSIEMKNF